ncbi:hypothetical protein JMJ77_0005485, partial [Colletotrichum scovillei]
AQTVTPHRQIYNIELQLAQSARHARKRLVCAMPFPNNMCQDQA